MLPKPFLKFIPKIFREDTKAIAMANKIDTHLAEWGKDVIDIKRFHRPDEMPSQFLDEAGYELAANILNTDSETIKRRKIYNAISTHKLGGTWKYDLKVKIDNITGLSAALYYPTHTADWILSGDGVTENDYEATMGVDGIDDNLGIDLMGDGTEVEIPGNVYINCHEGITDPVLSVDQLKQIRAEIISDVLPAYYRLYLGYVNSSGDFVLYEGTFNQVLATITATGKLLGYKNYIWAVDYVFDVVSKIDPINNIKLLDINTGIDPIDIASYNNYLWVSNATSKTISKIDPITNTKLLDISVNDPLKNLTFYNNYLWAINSTLNAITKIDITNNIVLLDVTVGILPYKIIEYNGYLWVMNRNSSNISKVDPINNTKLLDIASGGSICEDMVEYNGYLWVVNRNSNNISKIDTTTNTKIADVSVGNYPIFIYAFNGYIWVINLTDNTVSKVDPVTNTKITDITVGTFPVFLTDYNGYLWVINQNSNNISKIDTVTNTKLLDIAVVGGTNPNYMIVYNDFLWVNISSLGKINKINSGDFNDLGVI